MKKFSRILVPTDFSDESNRALEYALTFGSVMDLDVLVLHVVDSRALTMLQYSYGTVDDDYLSTKSHEDMGAEVKKVMGEEIEKGVSFEHQVRVTTHVRFGVPYDQICKTAGEKGADFIVMGAKGHTGLDDVLVGSVAAKVARKAPCPVFLVRPRAAIER